MSSPHGFTHIVLPIDNWGNPMFDVMRVIENGHAEVGYQCIIFRVEIER